MDKRGWSEGFLFAFSIKPNSPMLSPIQLRKPGSRPLSVNDGTGNTFVSEALDQRSFSEFMPPVWCDVCLSVCCEGGTNLRGDGKERRTMETAGKFCLIFMPKKVKKMLPVSSIPCPRRPFSKLSSTLGKHPCRQCNIMQCCTRENTGHVQKTSVGILLLSIKITYC